MSFSPGWFLSGLVLVAVGLLAYIRFIEHARPRWRRGTRARQDSRERRHLGTLFVGSVMLLVGLGALIRAFSP